MCRCLFKSPVWALSIDNNVSCHFMTFWQGFSTGGQLLFDLKQWKGNALYIYTQYVQFVQYVDLQPKLNKFK